MDRPLDMINQSRGRLAPMNPSYGGLSRGVINSRTIGSSDSNTILDTISSSDTKQYVNYSPQPAVQFNNKLKDFNSKFEQVPQTYFHKGSYEFPQDSDRNYFHGQAGYNPILNHVTPDTFEYSVSNDPTYTRHLHSNQNDYGNIRKYDYIGKPQNLNKDNHQYATLGLSPDEQRQSNRIPQDVELESTVFGQSPINQATHDNTTRFSEDHQAYFGNMKSNPTGSFSGTGNRVNFNSNLQSITSSSESTPYGFKTKLPNDMIDNPENRVINNDMDDDKMSFNPLATQEHFDLKKYSKEETEGNEIFIDHNVQPIMEQDEEESKLDQTNTPISTAPRGGYPVSSSSNTPMDINEKSSRFDSKSPYTNPQSHTFDKSEYTKATQSFPKFSDPDQGNFTKFTKFNLTNL